MGDVATGEVTVRVRIPAALRQTTGGRAEVEVRLTSSSTGGPARAGGGDGVRTGEADGAAGGTANSATAPVADVRALLDDLRVRHPDLERRVRDEQGRLRRHVNVFVGSTNIRDRDEQATALADGDEVAILPAVSGGT